MKVSVKVSSLPNPNGQHSTSDLRVQDKKRLKYLLLDSVTCQAPGDTRADPLPGHTRADPSTDSWVCCRWRQGLVPEETRRPVTTSLRRKSDARPPTSGRTYTSTASLRSPHTPRTYRLCPGVPGRNPIWSPIPSGTSHLYQYSGCTP